MKKHINIPIFIPHLGCPNQCVFCNQRTISGVRSFDIDNVRDEIEAALSTKPLECECEIAFFGGSFTGIDRALMLELLSLAYEYVKRGVVDSIRCSTRPDYIDEEILDILASHGVKTVELGLQSVDEGVLGVTKRGHGYACMVNACRSIKERGLELVGQMMIGLPGSTLESELKTARFIIDTGASAARIYPTVVFHDTELCDMARRGAYIPLSVDEAVSRSAEVCEMLLNAGVKLLRIGLCSSENLISESTYFAGPNHPALGELVEGEIFYKKIKRILSELSIDGNSVINIYVAPSSLSKAIGQKRRNKSRLLKNFKPADIKYIPDDSISGYSIKISTTRKEKDGCI